MQEAQETPDGSLGWEDPLEEEMATHSSISAWRISLTEEPGGLQSPGAKSQTGLSDWARAYDNNYSFPTVLPTLVVNFNLFSSLNTFLSTYYILGIRTYK